MTLYIVLEKALGASRLRFIGIEFQGKDEYRVAHGNQCTFQRIATSGYWRCRTHLCYPPDNYLNEVNQTQKKKKKLQCRETIQNCCRIRKKLPDPKKMFATPSFVRVPPEREGERETLQLWRLEERWSKQKIYSFSHTQEHSDTRVFLLEIGIFCGVYRVSLSLSLSLPWLLLGSYTLQHLASSVSLSVPHSLCLSPSGCLSLALCLPRGTRVRLSFPLR